MMWHIAVVGNADSTVALCCLVTYCFVTNTCVGICYVIFVIILQSITDLLVEC